MSPQRVIRTASRRPRAGARALLWPAAATSLPVVVALLVLVAVTLAVLVARGHGFGHLASAVAVEWLVTVHAPLTIDSVSIGLLPLLPTAVLVLVLSVRTRSALAVVDEPGPAPLVSAVAGTVLAPLFATVLACVVLQSSQSDFAVRASSVPSALAWTLAVGVVSAAIGAWAHHRPGLRERAPVWSVAGVHLGVAALMATFALGALVTTIALPASWGPVGTSLGTGKDFWGIAALALISIAYLPNLALLGATVALGADFHVGEASYSVFATAPGPLPELPLAAALPVDNPHWGFQALLVLPALAGVLLARVTAHWFATSGDGVRACLTGGVVAALLTAASSEVAGGTIGVIGSAGTAVPVAAGLVFLEFGVLGALTSALSLAGLTRRRTAERERLERRRRRAGTLSSSESAGDTETGTGSDTHTGSDRAAGVGEAAEVAAATRDDGPDGTGDDGAEPDDGSGRGLRVVRDAGDVPAAGTGRVTGDADTGDTTGDTDTDTEDPDTDTDYPATDGGGPTDPDPATDAVTATDAERNTVTDAERDIAADDARVDPDGGRGGDH